MHKYHVSYRIVGYGGLLEETETTIALTPEQAEEDVMSFLLRKFSDDGLEITITKTELEF